MQGEDFLAGRVLAYSALFRLWSIEHYQRCSFRCSFCCTDSQGRSAPAVAPEEFVDTLVAELQLAETVHGLDRKNDALIMSCLSDPYVYEEEDYGLTRAILDRLGSDGYRFVIVTRNDLVQRDLDVLQQYRGQCAVSFSLSSLVPASASPYESHAPDPARRLACANRLAAEGLDVTLRIDPWIPGVTDVEQILAHCSPGLSVVVSPLHLAGTLSRMMVVEDSSEAACLQADDSPALAARIARFTARGLCTSTGKHFSALGQQDVNRAYLEEFRRLPTRKNVRWFRPIYPDTVDIGEFYRFLKPGAGG